MSSMSGIDFSEAAKPLAQSFALCEVERFKFHVALSEIARLPEGSELGEAQRIALDALTEASA